MNDKNCCVDVRWFFYQTMVNIEFSFIPIIYWCILILILMKGLYLTGPIKIHVFISQDMYGMLKNDDPNLAAKGRL